MQNQKQSTFHSHPWLLKVGISADCSECLSATERGKWITDPVPLKASKQLYEKAKKHAAIALSISCLYSW